jgi:hypothetical protein
VTVTRGLALNLTAFSQPRGEAPEIVMSGLMGCKSWQCVCPNANSCACWGSLSKPQYIAWRRVLAVLHHFKERLSWPVRIHWPRVCASLPWFKQKRYSCVSCSTEQLQPFRQHRKHQHRVQLPLQYSAAAAQRTAAPPAFSQLLPQGDMVIWPRARQGNSPGALCTGHGITTSMLPQMNATCQRQSRCLSQASDTA